MLFLNIYFGGSYLTLLLFVLLLDNNSFRSYMEMLIESLIPDASAEVHPYTYFWPFSIILTALSWIGIVILCLLIIDWILWRKNK